MYGNAEEEDNSRVLDTNDDREKQAMGTDFLPVPRACPGSSRIGSQKVGKIGLRVVSIALKALARA